MRKHLVGGKFSFLHPHSPPQLYINCVWFSLDVLIVAQLLKFGRNEFSPKLSARQVYLAFAFAFALAVAFFAVLFVTYEFEDWLGAYAAFGQNLMMSALFIAMLLNRDSLRGQSLYIALFKMAGTGVSSLAFYLYQPISQDSYLMPFLYVSIFACDAIYLGMVYKR